MLLYKHKSKENSSLNKCSIIFLKTIQYFTQETIKLLCKHLIIKMHFKSNQGGTKDTCIKFYQWIVQ